MLKTKTSPGGMSVGGMPVIPYPGTNLLLIKAQEYDVHKKTKTRRQTMKGKMKALTALIALVVCGAAKGWSASVDSLTITVTPNVSYGVLIDTGNAAVTATLAPGSTFQTMSPATVTIQGNWATQALNVGGQVTASGTPWSFDVNGSTIAGTGGQDQLAMFLLFTSTTVGSAPGGDMFAASVGTPDSKLINDAGASGITRAGGLNSSRYTPTAGEMRYMSPGTRRHLWYFMRVPKLMSTSEQQKVIVTLTAVPGV